ncbi:DUF6126 family protein [Streptomyces sp. NPDC085946]|uniref:DUF6126 family protein n=1 Tax=Streptomyces sp. NPDC085946 TaxID=3365744 RepID=UPI0037D42C69
MPGAGPRRRALSGVEERYPRALWARSIIHIAVGHVFAAFVHLLSGVGAQRPRRGLSPAGARAAAPGPQG